MKEVAISLKRDLDECMARKDGDRGVVLEAILKYMWQFPDFIIEWKELSKKI